MVQTTRPFLLLLLAALLSLPSLAQTAPKKTKVVAKKTAVKARSKAKPTAKKAAAKPVEEEVEVPVVVFKRNPCFGKCPVYTANVFADGRVEYEGLQHVGVAGKKEFRLPLTTVAEMLRISQEAHFDQLKDFYSKGTTDIPSTVAAVLLPNGQMKAVTVEEGAPDELMGFISYLRSQLDPLAGLVTAADH